MVQEEEPSSILRAARCDATGVPTLRLIVILQKFSGTAKNACFAVSVLRNARGEVFPLSTINWNLTRRNAPSAGSVLSIAHPACCILWVK